MLIVVLFNLNLIALIGIGEFIIGKSLLLNTAGKPVSATWLLVPALLITVLVYVTFIRENKYKRLITEFEKESPHQRRTRGIGVLLYIVFSLVLLFAGAMLHGTMVSR